MNLILKIGHFRPRQFQLNVDANDDLDPVVDNGYILYKIKSLWVTVGSEEGEMDGLT